MSQLGRDVLLEVLRTEGVEYIFGNPGSTELPLMDALATVDDIGYALALQEATAVAMAEGYAQVTGRPAFLNLHTSAGLGNAIGNLTNAQADGVPLVVTAGQQDTRHLATDPLLGGNLTELAQGVSKWTHEIRNVDELGTIMRRAFQDAMTWPRGPVFVSLPMDLLDETTERAVPAPSKIERATVGAGLDELASLLVDLAVGDLAIVVGDEVSAVGGVDEVVALAETLGAPVHSAPLHTTGVFPQRHPLFAGTLVPAAAATAAQLAAYRRVLLIGGQAFRVYPYTPESAVPDGCELLHISPDAGQIGRAHPVRLGVVGDPRATVEALTELVRGRVDADAVAVAVSAGERRRGDEIDALELQARERYDSSPMDPMAAAHSLVRALPKDTPVVDEAITTGYYVRGFHHDSSPDRYFFCKGGGLGWGMPAALGVSLGLDRSPTLCVVGDGAAMYSPQALWTAASMELPVVFAVVNNRQYLILKNNLRGMKGDSVDTGNFVAMDLADPPVDYRALASSMGVASTLVESARDVGGAVEAALATGRPHLLELPIAAP